MIGTTEKNRLVRFETVGKEGLTSHYFRAGMLEVCRRTSSKSQKKKSGVDSKREKFKEASSVSRSREVQALRTCPEMRSLADLLARMDMNPSEGSRVIDVLQQVYRQSCLELEVSLKEAADTDEANVR